MDSPWIFSAYLAPDGAGPVPELGADAAERLRDLRRLRAAILFDGGRRPAFRDRSGEPADEQPQDLGAWHFTARRTRDGVHGPPLGYVRLLTPATAARYQSREYLGAEQYEEVLRSQGLTEQTVFEHSRLVVEHRARKLGLGLHLNALAVAAAHELGAAAMIGTSGTADGQDRFHARFGFHPVPGTRRYVEKYTEDVVLLLHRAADGAGEHTDLVDGYRLLFRELMAEDPGAVAGRLPVARGAEEGRDGLDHLAAALGRGSGPRSGYGSGSGRVAGSGSGHHPDGRGSGHSPGHNIGHGPAGQAGLAGSAGSAVSAGSAWSSWPAGSTGSARPTGLLGSAGPAGLIGSDKQAGLLGSAGPAGLIGSDKPAGLLGSAQSAGLFGPAASLAPLGPAGSAPPAPAVAVPHRRRPGTTSGSTPPRRLSAIGSSDPHRWKPVLFQPTRHDDRVALAALLNTGAVREVADTVEEQIAELVRAREPARVFDAAELAAARDDQLEGTPLWDYGSWAWYPWSGRLVHVLPREEYRLVRTDRNRGKIDRPEQRRLLAKRVGVVGLSVGNSAAVTLAQEGVAGAFKLADFDTLSVSNLNRLRAGLHQIGVNKAVLAARQMFEIDPYLDIEVFPAGLTEDNIKEFFLGGHGPIDLLVEECDTPWVKLAAREAARDLGVPVVMDANDRGLLDVERFDREPHRPLLHGLLGATTADDCRELTFEEKVRLVLAMVGPDRVSPALAASFPEIGRTLSSWPQLASGVALGGALVTEAARRILLGGPCGSGRFYVDLEELIAPDRDQAAAIGAATLPSAP